MWGEKRRKRKENVPKCTRAYLRYFFWGLSRGYESWSRVLYDIFGANDLLFLRAGDVSPPPRCAPGSRVASILPPPLSTEISQGYWYCENDSEIVTGLCLDWSARLKKCQHLENLLNMVRSIFFCLILFVNCQLFVMYFWRAIRPKCFDYQRKQWKVDVLNRKIAKKGKSKSGSNKRAHGQCSVDSNIELSMVVKAI